MECWGLFMISVLRENEVSHSIFTAFKDRLTKMLSMLGCLFTVTQRTGGPSATESNYHCIME